MLVQKAGGSPWTIVSGTGGRRTTWSKEAMLCDTDSLLSGLLQCVPPVLGVRRGCECRALLCSLGLLHTWVWSGAFLCVESLDHFCVPSPTACAEVKGGSVLTSPCQNPVESSGMRAGGRSAANGAIFLLWHLALRLHSHSVFCLGAPHNASLGLAVSSDQPVSPSPAFPDLSLSLGSSGGHGTPGIVISG